LLTALLPKLVIDGDGEAEGVCGSNVPAFSSGSHILQVNISSYFAHTTKQSHHLFIIYITI